MSALRVSYPGHQPVLLDLGPGSASTGEWHGCLAVPARSCQHGPVPSLDATPVGRRIPRTGIPDKAVVEALRATGGVIAAAGRRVGLTRQAVQSRLVTMEAEGILPADVAELLRSRRAAA